MRKAAYIIGFLILYAGINYFAGQAWAWGIAIALVALFWLLVQAHTLITKMRQGRKGR